MGSEMCIRDSARTASAGLTGFAFLVSAIRLVPANPGFTHLPARAFAAVVLVAAAIGDDAALGVRRSAGDRKAAAQSATRAVRLESRVFVFGLGDSEIAETREPLTRGERQSADEEREHGDDSHEPVLLRPERRHSVDLN